MSRFLIIGAGATGRATAAALVDGGHEVTMLTRSGGRMFQESPEKPATRVILRR